MSWISKIGLKLTRSLNQILNKNHNWYDYGAWEESANKPWYDKLQNGLTNAAGGAIDNLVRKTTGTGLTDAEKEANAFSATEAQKSRDFEVWMASNKYQLETQSMEQAGINPAMMYGGGQLVPTASNGAAPSSVAPSGGDIAGLFDLISTFARLPKELELLKSEAARNDAEATAALENAAAATRNADSAARNADVQERLASVAEYRAQFESALAASNIEVNSAQKEYLAKQGRKIDTEVDLMDDYLEVAIQNASAANKSALAALQQAAAANRNAATNEFLSSYQSCLMRGEAMLAWARGEGQSIMNQYLPDKTQKEIENLEKMGVHLDKENKLIDKEGKKVDAEIFGIYTHAAAEVSEQANNWVSTFVPNFGRTRVSPLGK